MNLRSRLQRLEQRAGGVGGCPGCSDRRDRIVLVTARRLPDGTVVAEEGGPPPCARCGQVPEQIIEVVEAVVDARTGGTEYGASP